MGCRKTHPRIGMPQPSLQHHPVFKVTQASSHRHHHPLRLGSLQAASRQHHPLRPGFSHVRGFTLLGASLLILLSAFPCRAQHGLTQWHYARSCPGLERVVLRHVALAHRADPGSTPALLRLLFHDCFVTGCDASVLLRARAGGAPVETAAEPNLTLDGFAIVEAIKADLERVCPGVVSCADILTTAARDSVRVAGGPTMPVFLGRTDGLVSLKDAVTLDKIPSSRANSSTLLSVFRRFGLNAVDLVALSGAHTFGNGRCVRLVSRFPPNMDNRWNVPYRNRLMRECNSPQITFDAEVLQDPITPHVFDNQYFKNVLLGAGLFTSDAVLKTDPRTLPLVTRFAQNNTLFFQAFRVSFTKMAMIRQNGPGEIRRVCHATNAQAPR